MTGLLGRSSTSLSLSLPASAAGCGVLTGAGTGRRDSNASNASGELGRRGSNASQQSLAAADDAMSRRSAHGLRAGDVGWCKHRVG